MAFKEKRHFRKSSAFLFFDLKIYLNAGRGSLVLFACSVFALASICFRSCQRSEQELFDSAQGLIVVQRC
jgi:hypothetical protein